MLEFAFQSALFGNTLFGDKEASPTPPQGMFLFQIFFELVCWCIFASRAQELTGANIPKSEPVSKSSLARIRFTIALYRIVLCHVAPHRTEHTAIGLCKVAMAAASACLLLSSSVIITL